MTIIEPYDDEEMVYDKENHRYKLTQAGAITEANGFQYIDGSLLPSVIQKMAITAVLAKSWVVPGIACTEEFQEGIDPNKVWSIWVEVQADIGPTTRTVGPNGTANNNGIVNFASSIVTTTIPLEIKPYRKFGARAYRNIILVVDNTYVPNAKLIGTVIVDETPGTPLTEPCPCVAPADWGLKVTTVVKNELSNGPDLKFVGKVNGASDPVTNGTTNPTKS